LATITQFDATAGHIKGKEYNGRTKHAMKLAQALNRLLPMPTVGMVIGGQNPETGGQEGLGYVIRNMLPTPRAGHDPSQKEIDAGNPKRRLETEIGMNPGLKLQPAFVEHLMGLPIGYTNISEE